MLTWQPEFQSDLPKINMQHFLLPNHAMCVKCDQDPTTGFGDIEFWLVFYIKSMETSPNFLT